MIKLPVAVTALIIVTFVSPATVQAQSLPPTGTLLCDIQYQHMMPVAEGSKQTIMESAGLCKVEKGGPAGAKVTYVVGLDFDEQGIGKLLYGGGSSTVDGKVIGMRKMLDAKYVIEFKEGKPVGWKSSGSAQWTAGEHAGKVHTWRAEPTGETTLRIDYVTKD